MHNHMNGFMGEHSWSWLLFGGVHMLAFWALVIAGIWLLARALTRPDSSKRPTPLDILKERYARGEIDKADYEQRKSDLER